MMTGEAVELEVRPASPVMRVGAQLIDVVASVLTVVLLMFLSRNLLAELSSSMIHASIILILAAVMAGIPWIVETSTRGQSFGKWAFGLRVVRDDGGVITARHSLVRALAGALEIWMTMGSIALVSAMVSPRAKRLGDYAAGTMVVREAEGKDYPPIIMPPELAEWARTAIILPLPQNLQVEAQTFLRTNRTLAPAVRARAADSLALRIREHVETAPPRTDAERFIAAVLVVTRDREFARENARRAESRGRREAARRPAFGITDRWPSA